MPEQVKLAHGTFTKMSVAQLTDPKQSGYFYHSVNHWWPVTEDECVVFFASRGSSAYVSPQCNSNETIAKKFRHHIPFEIAETRLIPFAFCPIDLSDYQY